MLFHDDKLILVVYSLVTTNELFSNEVLVKQGLR